MNNSDDSEKYKIENQQSVQGQTNGDFNTVHNNFYLPPAQNNTAPHRLHRRITTIFTYATVSVLFIIGLLFGFLHFILPGLQPGVQATVTPTEVALSTPTTSSSSKDPYIHEGTLVLNDPLNGPSNPYQWQISSGFIVNGTDTGSCKFTDQSYQVISLVQSYQTFYCWSQAQTFRDFVYQINVTLDNDTGAGMIFRLDSNRDFFYFGINAFQEYTLSEVQGPKVIPLLADKPDQAINPKGYANTLAVVVNGTDISMYINNHLVNTQTTNNQNDGFIGVAVVNSSQTAGQVQYTNAKVWSLDE
jgi:hypothetical protein